LYLVDIKFLIIYLRLSFAFLLQKHNNRVTLIVLKHILAILNFLKYNLLLWFALMPFILNAQSKNALSNLVIKKIAISDTVYIDSTSLVPNSLVVNGISDTNYLFLPAIPAIVWLHKPSQDSLQISYRVLPYLFSKKLKHKNINLINTQLGSSIYKYNSDEAANDQVVEFGNLDYNGSLSRAISFGNAQDVVLNSQFNLQLKGYITDSIEITAAITDNNIPFQPQGNTQKLQEFDRIFIQLAKRRSKLLLGDHELLRPNSYFMNFYKRVQGAYFNNEIDFNKNINFKFGVGASLAKGKFVRSQLNVVEGNQGPYRLIGPNGETFFIIMANSEKIIVDGLQLQRGEDFDYVIDYNTAEIIFMPRHMITKDSRVIVEYEFNDRNYLNSLLYATQELKVNNKLQIQLNAYSNQDAKNQAFQQELDDGQKLFLSKLSADVTSAYLPNVRLDTSLVTKVAYKITDTFLNGIFFDSIYVFSTNKDSAKYQVGFSFVGQGKGNYTTGPNVANGRVFVWVPPINGMPQGSYVPYTVIITPKQQHLFTLGTSYKLDSFKTISGELALSNNSQNLFSNSNLSRAGWAAKFNYKEVRDIKKSKNIKLQTDVNLETIDAKFKPLERWRTAEFNRDWNLDFVPKQEQELLLNSSFQLLNNTNNIGYAFSKYNRGSAYSGDRHSMQFNYNHKGFLSNAQVVNTSTRNDSVQSNYLRPSILLQHTFAQLNNTVIGTKCSLEYNQIKYINTNTLLPNAFAFNVAEMYLRTDVSKLNKWQLNYFVREDKLPLLKNLNAASLSHNFNIMADIASLKLQTLKINASYRKLLVHDTTAFKIKPDENLLGRLEYTINAFKNSLAYTLFYEFGAGQEVKRAFSYFEVPAGKGEYAWRDYNNDGIQQLNEFEIAQFPDQKKFIRIFIATTDYVKAKFNTLNQTLNFNIKQLYGSKKTTGFGNFASRIMLQSAWQLSNKNLNSNSWGQYNPFDTKRVDSNLIAQVNNFNTTIFFNRFGNVWGADFAYLQSASKSLLTYGIDTRKNFEDVFKLRFTINKNITLTGNAKYGERYFASSFLETRNYDFVFKNIEPTLSILTHKNVNRYLLNYKIEARQNKASLGGEMAKMNVWSIEYKHATANSGSINAKILYNNIAYNSIANNTLGYIMLDGLLPGKNYLWNVTLEKRVGKNIEMSIDYEGRKSATNNVVHTGRASVRAIF
jgi:hypothetical protein